MNIEKLFSMQKELDDYIVKTKGLEGQYLLPQKILALQVELGECANEWRGFKFWSNNTTPKTSDFKKCKPCHGSGTVMHFGENGAWSHPCKECDEIGHVEYNPLLEEYVDCLHFILSIGNDINFDADEAVYLNEHNVNVFKNHRGVTEQFNDIFVAISESLLSGAQCNEDHSIFEDLILCFLSLGEMLGFTWDQIESAYTEKWNINKQRQESGY